MHFDNTYVKIDLDIIRANFDAVRRKVGVPVMAIVKADAYGHGAVQVARLLEGKCAFFGVSSMLEALELRQAGLKTPILILGQTPISAFPLAIREGIRPAIFHYEAAVALSRAAQETGLTAPFHFAVDTGMSRIGFQATEEAADICAKIAALPGLQPEGLFSHFATADCADLQRSRIQAEKFNAFDRMLKERGVHVAIRHLDNSAGLMNFDTHYEMVRSGIVTYGLYPSEEVAPELLWLEPALACENPARGQGDQLRRHLCHHPSYGGGYHPGGLRRRLPQKPQREILCPDPGQTGSYSGPDLHGPAHGGRDGHSRRGA